MSHCRSRKEGRSQRSKRGISVADIEKMGSKQFQIIDMDKIDPLLTHSFELTDIVTKGDKVQKHQITRTLHQNVKISVPNFKIIRHELPKKSINPSLKSTNRRKFKLPNHYIQYCSAPDCGRVSFSDFYDLKKDDIDWLIHTLSQKSVNDNDHNIVMNKNINSRNNNISGNNLMELISKKHSIATHQYQTKCINSMNALKEQSIVSSHSNHSNGSNSKLLKQKSTNSDINNISLNMDQMQRVSSLSLETLPFGNNKTPPPFNMSMNMNDVMMRENSLSPMNDVFGSNSNSQKNTSFFADNSFNFGTIKTKNDINNHSMSHRILKSKLSQNLSIGSTRLTRYSLSKLLYFLEYGMYKRAKYKSDPERYFPLNEVLNSVADWDPSFDALDVEKVYFHWINRRRQIGHIEEKPLIRKFQEPPDLNDDDSNVAFRPRQSDERHVATRRQTKKPKKNTKESYLRLLNLMNIMQKHAIFWKKQLEIERFKKRMLMKSIYERQCLLHKMPYIVNKAMAIDMNEGLIDDMRYNTIFNTFCSDIIRGFEVEKNQNLEALNVENMDGNDGNHGYNEHMRDFIKYKRLWITICNRFVLSKTESIIDAMEEKAKNFSWRHTENVCRLMQLKPLSEENFYLLPESCQVDFDLRDERPYHWDLNDDENVNGLIDDTEQDIVFCEEEKEIMQRLSCQKNKTIQERVLNSVSYKTDIEYKFIEKNADKQLRPVSIPRITPDGSLEIQIYHPLVQTVDHIEYEPTPLTQCEPTKTVFDQFQIPIEHEIIHNSPIKVEKKVFATKKIEKKSSPKTVQGKKRKFEQSVGSKETTVTFPPAKRQKLQKNVQQNVPKSAPVTLKKSSQNGNNGNVKSSTKKKVEKLMKKNENENSVKQQKTVSVLSKKLQKNKKNIILPSMIQQNTQQIHRQQYIQLKSKQNISSLNKTKSAMNLSQIVGTTNGNKTDKIAINPIMKKITNPPSTSSVSSSTTKKKKEKSKKKKKEKKESKKKKKSSSKSKKKSSSNTQKNTLSKYIGFGKGNQNNSNQNGNDHQNNNNMNDRLPTPDGGNANTQNTINPTPPPAQSMALGGIPKFDIQFDPSSMTNFNLTTSNPHQHGHSGHGHNHGGAMTMTQAPIQQIMQNNKTPPTPPNNLHQFVGNTLTMGRSIAKHSNAASIHMSKKKIHGRPNNLNRANIDKRNKMNAQSKSYPFIASNVAPNAVIAMPPNNGQTSAVSAVANVQNRMSVPNLPQLPQLPSNGPGVMNVAKPNNANAIQSNLPSFAPQQRSNQQYASQQTQRQSPTHRQSVRHTQRVSPQRIQQRQRNAQRSQQSQPAFPSFGGTTAVPPPPSAIGSAPLQYANSQNMNALHNRQQRSVSAGGAMSHMPQFGATPSNSMISPTMNAANMHNQPISYRGGQHRMSGNGNQNQTMRGLQGQSIPLSPTMQRRSSRQSLSPRGKRSNHKEIIEIDK